MRNFAAFSLLALLAACGSPDEPAPANDQAAALPEIPAASGSDADPTGNDTEFGDSQGSGSEGENGSGDDDEPTQAAFDWTGTFAASPDLCRAGRWRFSRDSVVTDGHTSCQVNSVKESSGRAVLDLSCTAEGNDTEERWTLTQTGKDAFRVRRVIGSQSITVNLARCG